jgi:glucokinase
MSDVTAIGVDVGGTNIRAARISEDGSVLEWKAHPTASQPQLVVAQIKELFQSLNDGSAGAIGIGVPGRVDAAEGHVLSGGYVDLTGAPLAIALRESFAGPIIIDNDGNMALVAEQAVGRGRGIANIIMFTIGTGIGGAVFGNGRIFRGGATAGQLGHLTVDVNGEPCLCGRRGCVETTSSGTALGRHLTGAGLSPDTSVDELLAKSENGDTLASDVLTLWANPLRAAIDSAVAAFDPELVLLGGGLGIAAHRAIARFPAVAAWYQCPVEPAELGDRAGVIGAALSALASLSQKP